MTNKIISKNIVHYIVAVFISLVLLAPIGVSAAVSSTYTGPVSCNGNYNWTVHKGATWFGGDSSDSGSTASGRIARSMNVNGPFYFATWQNDGKKRTYQHPHGVYHDVPAVPWGFNKMILGTKSKIGTRLIFKFKGKCAIAAFMDQGPPHVKGGDSYLDLGKNLADSIGFTSAGMANVEWAYIDANSVVPTPTPKPKTPTYKIYGLVFIDSDSDGSWGKNETSRKSGVRVKISGSGINKVVTTDAKGYAYFTGLKAGKYALTETVPSGFKSTTATSRVLTVSKDNQGVAFGIVAGKNASPTPTPVVQKPSTPSQPPVAYSTYPTNNLTIQIKPGENDGKLATVQFSGYAKASVASDQVLIQVLYRKVGNNNWMSFGSSAVPSPDGTMTTPNGRLAGKLVNQYGWTCAMGYGKYKKPDDCNTVWVNPLNKRSGKSAWSGYKTYEPSVLLEAGNYEYVVRAYDVTTKKYSIAFTKPVDFTVKSPQAVKGFGNLKKALANNSTFGLIKSFVAKYHVNLIIGSSGDMTPKTNIVAVPFIDDSTIPQPQPVTGISSAPIGSNTKQSALNEAGSVSVDGDETGAKNQATSASN